MYLFPIANDDVINILIVAKGRQAFFDRVLVANVQEASLRLPEKPRVILDCISLSWCVNYAEHLLEVRLQELALLVSKQFLLDWEYSHRTL